MHLFVVPPHPSHLHRNSHCRCFHHPRTSPDIIERTVRNARLPCVFPAHGTKRTVEQAPPCVFGIPCRAFLPYRACDCAFFGARRGGGREDALGPRAAEGGALCRRPTPEGVWGAHGVRVSPALTAPKWVHACNANLALCLASSIVRWQRPCRRCLVG